jgi:hypothetical protein
MFITMITDGQRGVKAYASTVWENRTTPFLQPVKTMKQLHPTALSK